MADEGARAIERVRPGDLVQGRDPRTGQVVTARVTRTFVREVDHTVVLTLPGGEQVETTETHPFLVEGRGWVPAGELGIGTQILTRAGPALGIAGVERHWQPTRVYNFEVAGAHSYFVGSSGGGLCVHNTCDPEPGGPFRQIAERIGRGHAYLKRVVRGEEFDMIEEQFVDHVEEVMEQAEGWNRKPLTFGRTAYFDPESETIVVHDPAHGDLGTAFRGTAEEFRELQ